MARYVGAESQYKEDYDFLSGIEHGEINSIALMTDNFNSQDSEFNRFQLFKAIYWFGQMVDFGMVIIGKQRSQEFQKLIEKMDSISKQIHGKKEIS